MLELIAIGLAGWRIANLIVAERGPFAVFERLRTQLGVPVIGEPEGFFPELFSCVWCCSVWSCTAAWIMWSIWPAPVILVAAMGAAIVIHKWVNSP